MAKSREQLLARQLRRNGYSIKEIAKKVGVSVGSVSVWVRDVQLSPDQISALAQRRTDPFYGKKQAYLEKIKNNTEKKVTMLRLQGVGEVGELTKREVFLVGSALYWGEGFKKDHQVGLASLDKEIARFYVFWLKTCFGINTEDLIVRVTANMSYKSKIKELESFWSSYLKIPLTAFSKPYFQQTRWKKQYENPENYHGVIRIKVKRSQDLLRIIHGYMQGIILNVK